MNPWNVLAFWLVINFIAGFWEDQNWQILKNHHTRPRLCGAYEYQRGGARYRPYGQQSLARLLERMDFPFVFSNQRESQPGRDGDQSTSRRPRSSPLTFITTMLDFDPAPA
ncbi:MAG: hypothetical protein U0744_09450 [Gemmataceae bacterium]